MKKKILQYLEGNLPNEEQRELLEWLRKADNQLVFNSVKAEWWKTKHDDQFVDFNQRRIGERLKERQQFVKTNQLLQLYKYAAIALLVISLGSAIFSFYFLNGSRNLKYTEIHTDYGQVSGMTLPDGSEVWINAGTKLKYNNQYGINNRDIKVEGEAYFAVSKNKEIPFIVDLGPLKVEVTGTRFGVSNYNDSKTMNVILEEGSVNIHSASNKLLARMAPGEMGQFNKDEMTIEKIKVNPAHYISWKNGIMNVYELPLEQLVYKLERRYNQKFEIDPIIKDIPFTLNIEGESLPVVIHLIEKIAPVKAEQNGEIIKLKYKP